MTKSRPHGFIAGLCDFYFASFLVSASMGFWVSFSRQPVPLFLMLCALLGSLVIAALYHTGFSRRVIWLTPGEHLAGRIVLNGVKEWVNPYGRNRFALFSVMLLTIILSANAWDWIGEGIVYAWPKVLGTTLRTAAIFLGLVLMGKGKPWGVWFPVAIYGLGAVMATRAPEPEELRAFAAWGFGVLAVANGVVAFAYHLLRKATQARSAK